MHKLNDILSCLFLKFTGYTYSNLGRLFMRLFVGVMFLQFGIRQLINFHEMSVDFPTVFGWTPSACLTLMIVIELVCSLFIMVGFLTRLSVIPPIASMIAAEWYIAHDLLPSTSLYVIDSTEPGYLPIMFIGMFLSILIMGPGKISLDYFTSIFLLSRRGPEADHEEKILHEA